MNSKSGCNLYRIQINAQGRPLPQETACALKSLVLGSANRIFPVGWTNQSFGFSSQVSFGLVQHHGGPCGVLAAVQAHILKEKLKTRAEYNLPSAADKQSALVAGLVSVLKTCSTGSNFVLAMTGMKQHYSSVIGRFKADGITERLNIIEFSTVSAVESFLLTQIGHFMNDMNSAVVSFLYSVILTRGIEKIRGKNRQ